MRVKEETKTNSELLVAIVACIGTMAGSGLGILASNRLVMFRLEQLERHVEKHVEKYNNLAERMVVVERDLKTAFNKIEDLKE